MILSRGGFIDVVGVTCGSRRQKPSKNGLNVTSFYRFRVFRIKFSRAKHHLCGAVSISFSVSVCQYLRSLSVAGKRCRCCIRHQILLLQLILMNSSSHLSDTSLTHLISILSLFCGIGLLRPMLSLLEEIFLIKIMFVQFLMHDIKVIGRLGAK